MVNLKLKRNLKKHSKNKKSGIFNKKKKEKIKEKEGVEEESEVDIAEEKPKRNLPGLLEKSRENTNAAVAHRAKAKEEEEVEEDQVLRSPDSLEEDIDDSNETQVSNNSSISSSSQSLMSIEKAPKMDMNEEDHFTDNIIFEEVETTDPVKLAIKKCTEYGKHDLIIIGRTGAYRHHHNIKSSTIRDFIDHLHSNHQTVQHDPNSTPVTPNSVKTPLSNIFYRRGGNPSRTSISSVHSQTNSTGKEEPTVDLRGFRRRQQILLGELGGNLIALKNEVSSSIMVFRTVRENIYEDEHEFDQI